MTMPCSFIDVEYTYSTPLILEISCSKGLITRDSTSVGLAPAYPTKMSAIGTSICGSSSRGIKNDAYTPITINTIIKSTVSFDCINTLAIFPAIPSFIFYFYLGVLTGYPLQSFFAIYGSKKRIFTSILNAIYLVYYF